MSPNLFLCFRALFCPTYWFQRGERIHGSVYRKEHWDSPVPGIYTYIPGQGWHLVSRDDDDDDVVNEKEPVPLIYCRVLHRYLLEDDMEERCRWHSVKLEESARPVKRMFFRLDDGYTWVTGWDARGNFIPGPYEKWVLDDEKKTMRRMSMWPDSANVSRDNVLPAKLN